ncbi:hypothetical protein AB0442_20200 [Kitasatospora sp. NPDC085895]|uniref:hypothetical protein n=1 Tax=Kitasatospora sp. NPDC085895 TaxID=3155057 RepID=UPI00344CD041
MDEDGRAVRSGRRRAWIGAGAGVALLAVGGSARALPGGSEHPPAARPVPTVTAPPTPSPGATVPSPGAAAAAPTPTASPSADPARAASPEATRARATRAVPPTRRATATPRWQTSPRTDDPQNDGGSTTHNGACATNPAGEIMTCDPVKTGTPLPRTP